MPTLREDDPKKSQRPFVPPPYHTRSKTKGRPRYIHGRWAKPVSMPKGHINPPSEVRAKLGKATPCTAGVAAFILGISRTEFHRRLREGIYPAVYDKRGRAWFDEENIRRIAGDIAASRSERVGRPPLVKTEKENAKGATKNVKRYRHAYEAKTAAIVIAELRAGRSLEDIIIEKEVHPDEALAIFETWTKVKGWILLRDDHLALMAHLPLRGPWPPKSADQFVLMVRSTVECGAGKCVKCKAYARLCATCAAATPLASATKANGAHTSSVQAAPAPEVAPTPSEEGITPA